MPVECRLLPHGGYTLLPAVLSTMAWLASLAQDGCDYVRVTGDVVFDLTQSEYVPFIEAGFNAYRKPILTEDDKEWAIQYTGQCYAYNDSVEIDGFWKVAKGLAFLALVFGGGGALFLWFSSCFVFSPGTWRWAGYEVFVASFLQGLSFLWFRTEMCRDNTCSLFFGSKSDIVAAVFWFVSALLIFVKYPTPAQRTPETDSGDETDLDDTELELPVAGESGAQLPPPTHDPGALADGVKIPDAEIS